MIQIIKDGNRTIYSLREFFADSFEEAENIPGLHERDIITICTGFDKDEATGESSPVMSEYKYGIADNSAEIQYIFTLEAFNAL